MKDFDPFKNCPTIRTKQMRTKTLKSCPKLQYIAQSGHTALLDNFSFQPIVFLLTRIYFLNPLNSGNFFRRIRRLHRFRDIEKNFATIENKSPASPSLHFSLFKYLLNIIKCWDSNSRPIEFESWPVSVVSNNNTGFYVPRHWRA